jgi:hypothetical protein
MAASHWSGPVVSENGFQNGASSIEVITAGKTLTSADNGKTFILGDAVPGDITLPAVATSAGFQIKVVCGFAITTSSAVISLAGDIEGCVMVASTVVDVDGVTQMNFIESADNIGDWITLKCDGTYFYVDGRALSTGGITATSP